MNGLDFLFQLTAHARTKIILQNPENTQKVYERPNPVHEMQKSGYINLPHKSIRQARSVLGRQTILIL